MKIFKTMILGMICLLGSSVFAVESNTTENNSIEATAVNECSQTYSTCDALYPNSYSGFAGCMDRGGC